MRLFSLIFSAFLFSALQAEARTGSISGKVTDDSGQPLALASILLLSTTDSGLIKTELTDEKGEFHITPSEPGDFLLKVQVLGYEDRYSEPFSVRETNISLPTLLLLRSSTRLEAVAVRGQKPMVEVHADKLVVNVESSIVNSGSTALEVLSKSPGVTVDNNDNISLKGKQGVNVMINGKIQPLSGQDLANMLKSMPSSSVESIELISNPSSRYDAAGTGGIINIKLKRDKRMGMNGTANATYAQGVYGKSNAGLNVNYRDRRISLYASYAGSYREAFNHLTLDRNFFVNDVFAGAYVQDNNYFYNITSHTGSAGVDYNLTAKTIVGVSASAGSTNFNRDGYNYSLIKDSATRDYLSHFVTANNSPNHWNTYTANLNLRHTFDSAGSSLSVDADYAAYPSRGLQDYTTNYFDDLPNGTSVPSGRPAVVFHGDLTGLTQIRSLKADYSRPLANGYKLEAGGKTSYVTSDHDLRFYNRAEGLSVADTHRTNHFIYREQINAAYISASKDLDKWSMQTGLRVEQTNAGGDATTLVKDSSFTRHYTQLFPSIAVQRHLNKHNDLGLSLGRRIQRPNYEQLNPSSYYLDPTTYKTGYPYLNPALSYVTEFSYTYKQRFITSLNYTYTHQPITQVIQPSDTERKVTIQTEKNLSSMSYYGINGSYQFRFTHWWTNTTNVNVYYAQYRGDIAGTNLNAGKMTFDANTTNSFLLPRDWSAELGGFYQAPQVYGYMNLKPVWMLNVGIQKNFMDKRATARLHASDIFWHGWPRATSYYTNYVESFAAKRDTRQVALSFVYRFGKRSVAPSMRHRSGAEDERNRVSNGAG